MEWVAKPAPKRFLKRTALAAALLLVALAAGGCFVFDKERRENFKGPSWDVPLTIPLANTKVDAAELFELEEGGFEYSQNIDGVEKRVKGLPPGNVESVGKLDHVQPLADLWDELSVAEGVNVVLPGEGAVFIVLTLSGHEGLTTNFNLTLTPRRDGQDGERWEKPISLKGGASERVDISALMQGKPDELRVFVDIGVESDERLEDVTIKFDAELLVNLSTIALSFDDDGVEIVNPEPLRIDGDLKQSLQDIPLKNFNIVANITDARDPDAKHPAVPLEFAIEFYAGPPAVDPDPERYVVSLAGGQPDPDGWAKIRDKLSGPNPHAGVKVFVAGDDKKLVMDPDASYLVEAYLVIEMEVNKR